MCWRSPGTSIIGSFLQGLNGPLEGYECNLVFRGAEQKNKRFLVDAAFVEPPTVFTVESFDVLHILATDESEHSMEFGVIATIRTTDGSADLLHQALVCGTVLFKTRESVAAQEALFAAEVHICELNQPRHLLVQPRAAVSSRQLLPKRV